MYGTKKSCLWDKKVLRMGQNSYIWDKKVLRMGQKSLTYGTKKSFVPYMIRKTFLSHKQDFFVPYVRLKCPIRKT
jgi:hypothetical protein